MSVSTLPQDHKPGKKKPQMRNVWICNDDELLDEYEDWKEQDFNRLDFLMKTGGANEDVRKQHEEALETKRDFERRIRAASLQFKFKSIGRKAFDKIKSEHPPTDEAREKIKELGGNPDTLQWNPETFFLALCQASLVSPAGFDLADAWDSDDWNEEELASLGQTALLVNTTRRQVPLGNA